MNIKRILTSALVAVMIFTSFAAFIPVRADAAHSSSVSNETQSADYVKSIVEAYEKSSFASADEMFNYDLSNNYLDYSTDGKYAIYVNRYTGVMYYRNNETGEMLTSNPYSLNGVSGDLLRDLSSQILIEYATTSATETNIVYHSSYWAAKKNQINITKIDNGLRVSYAIGETAVRCLMPVRIEVESFEENILKPMMDAVYDMLVELKGEEAQHYFGGEYGSGSYNKDDVAVNPQLHVPSLRAYQTYLDQIKKDAQKLGDPAKKELANDIVDLFNKVYTVVNGYTPHNPNASVWTADAIKAWGYPICEEGVAIYAVPAKDIEYSKLLTKANIIKDLCPNYTFDMMYEDEEYCGYTHVNEPNPVFRCSLEYTFNDDGSLSVRLPSNSISFDETRYILKSITPIKYFGAGDFTRDGYFFLPDGSGTIVEFKDFNKASISLDPGISIYGTDYCYSEITGAHRQQITMPVYGISSTVDSASGSYKTGYFAILEEGASMAEINIYHSSSYDKAGAIYTTMTPYPTDMYDLSDTISVGGVGSYSMVAESKYTGSYVTRYVLLSNVSKYKDVCYAPTYIGMANYYRNYLTVNGVLGELENVSEDLPLYIEALGSMEVIEKIMTFPISVSKAITTFDDIATMYEELGDAKAKLLSKADEYTALAEAEEDNLNLKARYEQKAEDYKKLSSEIDNITNVNFKLTGFSNGGMYFTYPSKVKWERVVGGKKGFKELLELSASYSKEGKNLGIYPDFDFQYINNTELFDGIGKRDTVSKMVDNRYASRQEYSPITGEYDSIFAMIVSPDVLDKFYSKFVKKYGKYDIDTISLSTLGSDLNSNFDEDNPISRDEAQGYVTDLLDRVVNDSNYKVMISTGNIYAVEYAEHILGVATDSSYYRYSSYAIPFVGMILHGHVSYSGGALNYSGSPSYDILRSIENGAAPYYVLGYRNTELMKDDEELNDYYSVSYDNWFDDIVENYSILNNAIGDLQKYIISDHKIILGERAIDDETKTSNFNTLKAEFVNQFDKQLAEAIDDAYIAIRGGEHPGKTNVGILVDIEALVATAKDKLELDDTEAAAVLDEAFRSDLNKVVDRYGKDYSVNNTSDDTLYNVSVTVDYESEYLYVTGSEALDGDNYVRTDYTVDSDLIVMVTYSDGENSRTFILNYNIWAVEVTLNGQTYVIDKYGAIDEHGTKIV